MDVALSDPSHPLGMTRECYPAPARPLPSHLSPLTSHFSPLTLRGADHPAELERRESGVASEQVGKVTLIGESCVKRDLGE